MTRQPAVAGSFYPANPEQLHLMVDRFLNDAASDERIPKAIIAPHAGYIYSGPIAASAYSRLKKAHDKITRVVLIGPSHRVAFRGLAVSRAKTFTTPLGDVLVDQAAIQAIVQLPFVEYIERAHTYEHSLEVHLPFLQEVLDDFKIVPIVAGEASPEQVSQVLSALWGGAETLIVVSSDLSHYHDYATARQMDKSTTDAIEQLQYEQLASESACGKVPLSGLLKLARKKSLSVKNIDLRNSGDTAGDKASVVGYGAYVIE
ncbi:AmmeMemoRadiSam system protein B [Candidatus Methylobacter oryzae]|uniref:MEMO1 family protein EKO24_009705 n=1 Tax=Candidatus Methylobacter oryzae TaxID=2497749 RepID=A0ABY3CAS8_9GAMM|nr:AmmeMemoRadiSam system protein B [Candidatus Methylobacter oryzae]TRW95598.1 AmmeMemoRadiSam system protein B [Candidatus Methylobacter oryzae]